MSETDGWTPGTGSDGRKRELEAPPALSTFLVLEEVRLERRRQDGQWGEQNHPRRAPWLDSRAPERAADEYEIATANRAKQLCQGAARNGEVDWCHILVEEVAEFVGALTDEDARAELVQVAAVAVAAIESMDRAAVREAERSEAERVEPAGP